MDQTSQQPTLYSERLVLRKLTLDDAPQIQKMASDKRVSQMTASIPYPYSEAAAIDWISQHVSNWQAHKQVNYGIIQKSSQAVIGAIGLVFSESKIAELGYWIGVDYWGSGYATEASKRIISFGFNELGLDCIEARRLSKNSTSGRVLLKSNFKHIRTEIGRCGRKYESLDYYVIHPES